MGNSRTKMGIAALLGALLAMSASSVASATDWKALKPLCGAVHQKEGTGDEASPACKAALATLPVDRQTCATICGVDGGKWDSEKSRCTITDAWPNLSPNGCLVAAHTWGGMGGGGGAVCVDSDKDGVPDAWTPVCKNDPKFADARKRYGDKPDNCPGVKNGLEQAKIETIGDQVDLHGPLGEGGPDGVGDICQYSPAAVTADLATRIGLIEAVIAPNAKNRAEFLAELDRIKAAGGLATKKDVENVGRAFASTNQCLATGQVPVLEADGSPTGACAENPELAAVKADVAKTDAAIHAVERRTATVAVVGLAEGFGRVYGVAGGELRLVVRPSPKMEGRIGLAYGAPIGIPEKRQATRAMQAGAGITYFGYEGDTCRVGLGGEAIAGAAYNGDFESQATSVGMRALVQFQCGHLLFEPSVGAAFANTPDVVGVTAAYGGVFGYQW